VNETAGDQTNSGTDKASRGRSIFLRVLDGMSKYAAPIATILAAIISAVFLYIANNYQSTMSGITLLNQREQAESNLRAAMFQNLINPIVGNPEKGQKIQPERELLLTELLALNFDEHIELKPLMLLVDQTLAEERAKQLKRLEQTKIESEREEAVETAGEGRKSLQSIARRVIDRQVNVLRMEGEKTKCDLKPVEMFFAENPKTGFLYGNVLPALARSLKDGSALSSYLRKNFSKETQDLLNAYNPDQPESFTPLQMTLTDELNKVINGPSLYDKQRFQDITLSQKTRELIKKIKLNEEEVTRLNWLLLKDAYSIDTSISICQWTEHLPGRKNGEMLNGPPVPAPLPRPVCTSLPGKEHGFPENPGRVEVSVIEADFENDRFKVYVSILSNEPEKSSKGGNVNITKSIEPFKFELTHYDFPFTDNTAISSDFRFALVLNSVDKENQRFSLKLVWFPPKYITPRERPINYSEMRKITKKL
jgi:hypothetical protein